MTRARSSRRNCLGLCPAAGAFLAAATLLSTLFILHLLPPPLSSARHRPFLKAGLTNKVTTEPQLGRYGELMLSFLRSDLPFTVFIPIPSVFETMLLTINRRSNSAGTLSFNSSVFDEENVYAVVSRIFGFSAIPRRILSGMLALNHEVGFEALSGFELNLVRVPPKGALTVNNLACHEVDIVKGSIVVHLVDGILMDVDFEQSVMPYQDGVDDDMGMV